MLNQPKEFWDMRARDYDATSGSIYAKAYDLTVQRAADYLRPGDRLLDFACGTGLAALRLAPYVSSVRGIDISPRMVEIARKKAAGLPNVEITNTGLFDPCLKAGSFDVAAAFNVLCYLPDLPGALSRIHELLRPGGVFLSATNCLGGWPTKAGIKKFVKSHTGAMPYVAFFTQKSLARKIAQSGFHVLAQENLFPAPPNLFIAARKAGPAEPSSVRPNFT